MRNLTPIQRILRDLPEGSAAFAYTEADLEQIRAIRCLVQKAEEIAQNLNGDLRERIGREMVTHRNPEAAKALNRLLEEMDKGFTRITLAVF